MDALTRRKFLIRSGVVGGAALAAGGGAFTLAEILKTANWQDKRAGACTLVLVTLCSLFVAAFDFGQTMSVYLVTVHATREAARAASVAGTTSRTWSLTPP